jgi:hypothetical protein
MARPPGDGFALDQFPRMVAQANKILAEINNESRSKHQFLD